MRKKAKCGFSLFLVLVICVNLLSGLTFTASAATVDYVYDGEYIYNWGQRGTTATFLSPNAQSFYSDNGTSYEELSALAGASSVSQVPSSALYQKLKTLMAGAQTYQTSYEATKSLFRYTDCQNSGGQISSFYSGQGIGPSWDGTWNREHTWPNSKGDASGNGENDIMMLRPTAVSENSSRGNTAYGESSGYYDPNEEAGGAYDLHGDVARIMLFVYTRWGNTASMWGASGVIESKELLLRWMEEDPVDTWELGRNDAVESITGTRNVYVDYPELAFILFDTPIPSEYDSPSGEGAASAYTVTPVSSNESFGTVSLSGRNINAVPAEGYYAAGYTILSGEAEVIQSGNVFAVSAASDCRIQINFQPRELLTVSFYENGTVTGQNVYLGDELLLPQASASVPDYTFRGWTTAPVEQTTQKPTEYYTAGSSYTVTENQTLYALYSRVGEGTETSTVFEPFSGELEEGDYILTAETAANFGAMQAEVVSGRLNYAQVSLTDDQIQDPDPSIVWHIAPTGTGAYTLYNESTDSYAGGTGVKNKAELLSQVTDYAKWTYTWSTTYDFVNVGNEAAGVNANLRRNNNFGFACYSSGTGLPITLYKGVGGTVYYTTSVNVCSHTGNVREEAALQPTCTQPGREAAVYCEECGALIQGGQTLPAAGHSYIAVVTPPTQNDQGYTTHTCENCLDSYVDSYVEALGPIYQVCFCVPQGVEAVAPVECTKDGIVLPEAGIPQDSGYTFVGWTEAAVDGVTEKPVFHAVGDTYMATEDITLYALYTYTVEDGDSTAPASVGQAVTAAPESWEGQYVMTAAIVSSGTVYALLTDGTAPGTVSAAKLLTDTGMTLNGSALEGVTDSYILVVEQQGDYYTLRLKGATGDSYLMTTNSNSGFSTTTDTSNAQAQWSISWDDANENVVIQNAQHTSRTVRFNASSKQFRTYTSGQSAVTLYAMASSGKTVCYTTGIAAPAGFHSAGVVLDAVLGVRFYTENTSGTVKVTVGDRESVEVEPSAQSAQPGLREYSVDVFAQDMMSTVTAALYDPDGQLLDTKEFVLKDYVAAIGEMEDQPQQTKELAYALLNYCQYTAKLKGNYDGQLNDLAPIPQDAFADHDLQPDSNAKGISIHLYLEEACQLRMRLSEEYADCTVTVDGTQVELSAQNGTYVGATQLLLPQDYGTPHTFGVLRDGVPVHSGQYSVLMYLGKCIQFSIGTQDQQALFVAMYHYYAAAQAYINAV